MEETKGQWRLVSKICYLDISGAGSGMIKT